MISQLDTTKTDVNRDDLLRRVEAYLRAAGVDADDIRSFVSESLVHAPNVEDDATVMASVVRAFQPAAPAAPARLPGERRVMRAQDLTPATWQHLLARRRPALGALATQR